MRKQQQAPAQKLWRIYRDDHLFAVFVDEQNALDALDAEIAADTDQQFTWSLIHE